MNPLGNWKLVWCHQQISTMLSLKKRIGKQPKDEARIWTTSRSLAIWGAYPPPWDYTPVKKRDILGRYWESLVQKRIHVWERNHQNHLLQASEHYCVAIGSFRSKATCQRRPCKTCLLTSKMGQSISECLSSWVQLVISCIFPCRHLGESINGITW